MKNILGNFKITPIKIKPIKLRPINLKYPFGKNFKEKGHDFELRVKRILIKKGYKVSKAKNRHYDWHATKNGKNYLIECKLSTSRISPHQEKLMAKSIKKGTKYVLARKTDTGKVKFNFY